MRDDRVLIELAGQVATVTLNREDKLNAIDPEMLAALERIVRLIERDPGVRVVILTGAGARAFCVGADVNAWAALEPLEMWRRWVRDGHYVFDTIARLRQPVIAAINGYALGGGLELALAADVRIAAAGAQFGTPEVKIGTVPGWGGTQRLPALIGMGRAKQLIFTGARIGPDIAERWGLVNEVVTNESLAARARELAEEIAANAPHAVQIAKQIVDAGAGDGLSSALESLAGGLAATTEDGKEGISSFREKRQPRFTGA
ncbi:MAG: enoyl-CoA hydratase/isomerase family protein [Thermomicrobiales bacterium]